jgi:hypothetical protein
MCNIIDEVLNVTAEEAPRGPQAYSWGWQDAMQKVREKVAHHIVGGGNGIVREVASDEEVKAQPTTWPKP